MERKDCRDNFKYFLKPTGAKQKGPTACEELKSSSSFEHYQEYYPKRDPIQSYRPGTSLLKTSLLEKNLSCEANNTQSLNLVFAGADPRNPMNRNFSQRRFPAVSRGIFKHGFQKEREDGFEYVSKTTGATPNGSSPCRTLMLSSSFGNHHEYCPKTNPIQRHRPGSSLLKTSLAGKDPSREASNIQSLNLEFDGVHSTSPMDRNILTEKSCSRSTR